MGWTETHLGCLVRGAGRAHRFVGSDDTQACSLDEKEEEGVVWRSLTSWTVAVEPGLARGGQKRGLANHSTSVQTPRVLV